MYQSTTLIGNVGSDPEMRYTPNGVPVANFSLATSKSWVDTDGSKQDKTTWWRVTVWRKQAETIVQYVSKGDKLLVVGELDEARTYTGRDGTIHVSLEFTARDFKFLSTRAEKEQRASATGGQPQRGQPQAPHQERAPTQDELIDAGEIPF